MVRIIHDPRDEPDRNPGAEVFALQQDFQARLADETLRYLRSLRGLLGPASPGTVLRPQPDLVLRADALPGGVGEISFEVENRQEVHVIATPMLTPLVRADGTTWFPDAVAVPASTLVAPAAVGQLRMIVNVPEEADAGQYDGALVLLGMKGAVVQVSFTVTSAPSGPGARAHPARSDGQKGAPRPSTAAREGSTKFCPAHFGPTHYGSTNCGPRHSPVLLRPVLLRAAPRRAAPLRAAPLRAAPLRAVPLRAVPLRAALLWAVPLRTRVRRPQTNGT